MTSEMLISDEAVKDILGMIKEEADGWRSAVDGRERDSVEEAGFLDAIHKTIEALVKRREAERANDLRETLQQLVGFIKFNSVDITYWLNSPQSNDLARLLNSADALLNSTRTTA